MTLSFSVGDIDDYALGCGLLGSGGGGDSRLASLLLRTSLDAEGPVLVHPVEDLPGSARVALVGAVGSPTVMTERLPSGHEFALAIHRLERATGHPVDAVAPLEIGGVNGLLGLLAARRGGRRVVDVDGMGRAFARLDQCVLSGVVEASPLVLCDPSGGTLVLDGLRPGALGATVAAVLPALGTWAAVACFPTAAAILRDHGVTGSVSRALRLGRMVRRLSEPAGPGGPAAQVDAQTHTQTDAQINAEIEVLVAGTVAEVRRTTSGRGAVTIVEDGFGDGGGGLARTVRLDHVEEFEAVTIDGAIAVTGPDVIAVCDARTWQPLGVADLRVGQRVRVLAIGADDRSRGRDREPEWLHDLPLEVLGV